MARITGLLNAFPGDTTRRTTTQELPLGTRCYDGDGNEYIYVKAGEALDAKNAVRFGTSTTIYSDIMETDAVDQYVLGVADVAFASGEYGWILHRGKTLVLCTDAVGVGTMLFTSATAGLLTALVAGTAGGDAVTNRSHASRVVVVDDAANSDTDGAVCFLG